MVRWEKDEQNLADCAQLQWNASQGDAVDVFQLLTGQMFDGINKKLSYR